MPLASLLQTACLLWIGGIAGTCTVVALFQAWKLARRDIRRCEGVILSSRLESGPDALVHNAPAMFWPSIRYRYQPGAEALESEQISVAQVRTTNRAQAAARLAPFPEGASVHVFYDAADPREAWLINPRKHIATNLLLALAFAAVGSGLSWLLKVMMK